jgi:ribose/xylose/arabinose/galactoside ABC-type transport system permease subunit
MLGAVLLQTLTAILVAHSYGVDIQEMLLAAVILIVVAGSGREPRLSDRV